MKNFICKTDADQRLICTVAAPQKSNLVRTANSSVEEKFRSLPSPFSTNPEVIAKRAGRLEKAVAKAQEEADKRNATRRRQKNPRGLRVQAAAPAWTDEDFRIPCKQAPPKNLSRPFLTFLAQVNSAATNAQKDSLIEAYLAEVLQKNGRWPLVDADGVTATFVYRNYSVYEPVFVGVFGEHNGWTASLTPENGYATRISLGGEYPDFFYFRYKFESDARIDYKIYDSDVQFNWILDPLNPLTSPGGLGANSTIVMPKYCPPRSREYHPDIPHGRVIGAGGEVQPFAGSPVGNPLIDPNNIDRILNPYATEPFIIPDSYRNSFVGGAEKDEGYWVYLPAEYDANPSKRYPVLYFGDGNDYLQFGGANNTLDYLIACKEIPPVIAVFHREQWWETYDDSAPSFPVQAPNWTFWDGRGYDTAAIAKYDPATPSVKFNPFQDFLQDFLVPEIDSQYRTIQDKNARVIIGDSSLASAAFNAGCRMPEMFGRVLAHSLLFEAINNLFPDLDNEYQGLFDSIGGPTLYRNDYILPKTQQALLDYIGTALPAARKVKFYITWGTYEYLQFTNEEKTTNPAIVNYLKSKQVVVKGEANNQGHTWSMWSLQMEKGLPYLLEK